MLICNELSLILNNLAHSGPVLAERQQSTSVKLEYRTSSRASPFMGYPQHCGADRAELVLPPHVDGRTPQD
jgi:hypothetical protein